MNKTILKARATAKERNWDKIYWAIDIHGTILVPDYKSVVDSDQNFEFYPMAKECLQKLTQSPDSLILYTCSWHGEIEVYKEFFAKHGIVFDHVNCNPEVGNTRYGYYEDKPYFNVLLDDKAGFEPEMWVDMFKIL